MRRALWASCVLLLVQGAGCSAQVDTPSASHRQALCTANNGGGDLNCPCTDNDQCNGADNDTRNVICNVADGAMVGACFDCLALGGRPVGCVCDADTDCASPAKCNGRTCQTLRARGEFCLFDSDCGSDAMGAMTCLPTKHFCGPLDIDYFCDFSSDCLSGLCSGLGVCTAGVSNTGCTRDKDCTAPNLCSSITAQCVPPAVDGTACRRNAECQGGHCNSFSGLCQPGDEGTPCTQTLNAAGPDGDCATNQFCTNCANNGFTCRPSASDCP